MSAFYVSYSFFYAVFLSLFASQFAGKFNYFVKLKYGLFHLITAPPCRRPQEFFTVHLIHLRNTGFLSEFVRFVICQNFWRMRQFCTETCYGGRGYSKEFYHIFTLNMYVSPQFITIITLFQAIIECKLYLYPA